MRFPSRALVAPLCLALAAVACGAEAEGAVLLREPPATERSTVAADAPPEESAAETSVPQTATTARPAAAGITHRVEVVARRDHDPTAFTQGLEQDGATLFESRGLYGQSALTQIDPEDGSTLRRTDIDGALFAEGLTVAGDRVIVLTYQEETALVFDRETLELVDTLGYEGEGWGLCRLGDRLVRSDGTDRLTFHHPEDFAAQGQVAVTLAGQPVDQLNELECVGDTVWANVWKQDAIIGIDPTTGVITAVVDATGLLSTDEAQSADVLNGIAHLPDSDTWLLTGKYWPAMFEVEFVPV